MGSAYPPVMGGITVHKGGHPLVSINSTSSLPTNQGIPGIGLPKMTEQLALLEGVICWPKGSGIIKWVDPQDDPLLALPIPPS
jgi:hypothetical protein